MATVQAVITDDNRGGVLITWAGLATEDDGSEVDVSAYTDLTVHSDGTYDTEAFAMQGSNNAVAWFALTNPAGDAISLTADTVGALIVEEPKYIRPLGDGAGTTVDVDVIVRAKKLPRY